MKINRIMKRLQTALDEDENQYLSKELFLTLFLNTVLPK